ncbi:MAG: DEAD/DEAH box helicase, partial [Planctomycetes bacterium]|nr:DEAD/DEAH box helicase [Planctomycetota bacterium]
KKRRVQLAVNNLAKDLLEIQSVRRQEMGTAYPLDTTWQKEFESSFPFEDTEDQVQITQDIKKDMEARKPMDRLICGDVGYGKTELAMRAAFKAAVTGKQVAVLVPTTILAQQHYKNFTERMADYPLKIGILSRFKTKKEQRTLVKMLADGEVDIVIGTHRLLQKDIKFKNLGLAIVDEEQRFGVENKEFFKKIRATVDVLTLTATPIPRTLHMALMGVRDISNLLTPPPDRRAIKSEVCFYDEKRIREGILNELNRDGQVFFVHNRVMDIDKVADRIRYVVPEARINVVHGQMKPELLEERMLEFITGECNVLVTTTIIESGVDIPNANTLFVNEADYFGLADLHQLRGRVGRYKNQAYAYFLLPRHRPITPEAEKRIKAIEEYMELGAGFKIAVRDLEIRGAGNMLGKEQSGHIMAVGYDLYCRLLHQAIRRIKNEKFDADVNCVMSLNLDLKMPDGYIPDERQRLHFYKLLSKSRGVEDVDAVRNIMIDMYGRPPEEMEPVFDMARIKALAEKAGIYEITQSEDALEFKFVDMRKAEAAEKALKGALHFRDDRAAYLPLKDALESPEQLPEFLKGKLKEITDSLR